MVCPCVSMFFGPTTRSCVQSWCSACLTVWCYFLRFYMFLQFFWTRYADSKPTSFFRLHAKINAFLRCVALLAHTFCMLSSVVRRLSHCTVDKVPSIGVGLKSCTRHRIMMCYQQAYSCSCNFRKEKDVLHFIQPQSQFWTLLFTHQVF